jgi:uncharacterized protein YozE (UPF0346 family)
MAASPSFYEWLTKQAGLRSPLGGLARDAARDGAFPKDVASLEALIEYVRTSSKGSAQAVAVARSAFRAFARSQAPAPRG